MHSSQTRSEAPARAGLQVVGVGGAGGAAHGDLKGHARLAYVDLDLPVPLEPLGDDLQEELARVTEGAANAEKEAKAMKSELEKARKSLEKAEATIKKLEDDAGKDGEETESLRTALKAAQKDAESTTAELTKAQGEVAKY